MAIFCSDDCSSICDFCIHYRDEYRDIQKIGMFAGDGICAVDGTETDAISGYDCENFICFRTQNGEM